MELQSNQGISTHPAEVRQILNSNQVMEGDGFPVSRPFPVAARPFRPRQLAAPPRPWRARPPAPRL